MSGNTFPSASLASLQFECFMVLETGTSTRNSRVGASHTSATKRSDSATGTRSTINRTSTERALHLQFPRVKSDFRTQIGSKFKTNCLNGRFYPLINSIGIPPFLVAQRANRLRSAQVIVLVTTQGSCRCDRQGLSGLRGPCVIAFTGRECRFSPL